MTDDHGMFATYDPDCRVHYIDLCAGNVTRTIELSPSVNVDVDKDGRVVGVEVLEHG